MLYKTVFIPIISYGYRVWKERIDKIAIANNLRVTKDEY